MCIGSRRFRVRLLQIPLAISSALIWRSSHQAISLPTFDGGHSIEMAVEWGRIIRMKSEEPPQQ